MARSREGRPPHLDDEAPHRGKHPGGKYEKRARRERTPDSGSPSIATAHDVMMLTRAERAALSDQDFDRSLQRLVAESESGRVRNPRARGQLEARITEMRDERPASKPIAETKIPPDSTEPPSSPLKSISEVIKPPTEPSPEPIVSATPLASELANNELEKALEAEQAARFASANPDDTAKLPVPEAQPIEHPANTAGSGDISEEELRKILGDDYDDVMGIKPAVDTAPAVANVNRPVEAGPDTASQQADLGSDADTPATPNASTVERKVTNEWLKPDLTSAHEVLGLEPDDIAGLSPEDLATARATLAAKMEGYNGRNAYADRALADQFRRIDQRLRETPGAVTAPEHIPEAATDPTLPDTAPESAPDSEFTAEEKVFLSDYGRILNGATGEELGRAGDQLDLQTRQILDDIDATADPEEQARLRRNLNFIRARRDMVSRVIITRRDRASDTGPADTDAARPDHLNPIAAPVYPDRVSPEPTHDTPYTTDAPPETRTDLYTEEAYVQDIANASNETLADEQDSLESRIRALTIELEALAAHKPPESDKEATLAYEFSSRDLQRRLSILRRQAEILGAEMNRRALSARADRGTEIPGPESPTDNPPPQETFARPESGEPREPTPLELARAKAARALMKRGQIFGRVGNEEVNQSIVEYQAALAAEQQPKVEQIKQDFAGRDLSQPDMARELQTRLVELALNDRFAEETALREAMKSAGERSAGHRFKEFWRKNSGKRALIGLGLLGAGIATGGLASPVLGAAILGARVAMSSAGSTMMAEGGLQSLIEKKGWTKKFTAEQISRMSRAQLRTRLAAHITRYGETGQGEFGTHTTRLMKKTWSDDTGKLLLAEYQLDQQKEIEDYLHEHAGETPEQIIAGVLDNSLDEQSRLHEAFAFDRADNRLRAVFKWVASIGVGMMAGATVALAGMDRLDHVRAAKSAAKSGLEHAGHSSNAADVSHGAGATMAADTGSQTPAGVETGTRAAVEAGGHAAPAAETGAGASVEAGRQAAERAASFKEVAHKGDSVWKLVTDQLHRRLGDNFDKLDPARKAYIIDSIKDQIIAHPQEFGLDNVDQLAVGKEIDFTAAFEGPHAVNLPEVVSHAKELSQQAVDSITHNNEVIGQWISNHPGEPINDTIIDHLIHGANITATDTTNPTAELLGASHDQLAAAFTDHMTQNAIQKSILDLANTNPELYARFHEVNPDCYPAVAGVTVETAAPVVESSAGSIELSSSNLNALSKGLGILEKLPQTGTTREVLHSLGEMKATDAAKVNAFSAPLGKAGIDLRSAKLFEQSMRKVFMEISERVGPDMKVKNVLETVNKKLA